MSSDTARPADREQAPAPGKKESPKKPYAPPRLSVHGAVETHTGDKIESGPV